MTATLEAARPRVPERDWGPDKRILAAGQTDKLEALALRAVGRRLPGLGIDKEEFVPQGLGGPAYRVFSTTLGETVNTTVSELMVGLHSHPTGQAIDAIRDGRPDRVRVMIDDALEREALVARGGAEPSPELLTSQELTAGFMRAVESHRMLRPGEPLDPEIEGQASLVLEPSVRTEQMIGWITRLPVFKEGVDRIALAAQSVKEKTAETEIPTLPAADTRTALERALESGDPKLHYQTVDKIVAGVNGSKATRSDTSSGGIDQEADTSTGEIVIPEDVRRRDNRLRVGTGLVGGAITVVSLVGMAASIQGQHLPDQHAHVPNTQLIQKPGESAAQTPPELTLPPQPFVLESHQLKIGESLFSCHDERVAAALPGTTQEERVGLVNALTMTAQLQTGQYNETFYKTRSVGSEMPVMKQRDVNLIVTALLNQDGPNLSPDEQNARATLGHAIFALDHLSQGQTPGNSADARDAAAYVVKYLNDHQPQLVVVSPDATTITS